MAQKYRMSGSITRSNNPSGGVNNNEVISGGISSVPSHISASNTYSTPVSGTTTEPRTVIGGVVIGRGGIKEIFSDTTANWNAQPLLLTKKDCLYIYTDYTMDGDTPIPSIKVGTGNAYLIDLPFVYSGNISAEQIAFWNNKVTAYMDEVVDENLILTKN